MRHSNVAEQYGGRLLNICVVCVVAFVCAAAMAGPRIVAKSNLAAVVGANPDCDTPLVYSNNCPTKIGAPGQCPTSQKYTLCKASSPGNNDKLCKSGGNRCTVNTNCQQTMQDIDGGKCNDT